MASGKSFEVERLELTRRLATGAVKSVDLNSLRLNLWFALPYGEAFHHDQLLVHIHELAPIEDDKGNSLLSPSVMRWNRALKEPSQPPMLQTSRGKDGPVVGIGLDAPARDATDLRQIKGKVTISGLKIERVEVRDLSTLKGVPIEDKFLDDFPIEARGGTEEGDVRRTGCPARTRSDWRLRAIQRIPSDSSRQRSGGRV